MPREGHHAPLAHAPCWGAPAGGTRRQRGLPCRNMRRRLAAGRSRRLASLGGRRRRSSVRPGGTRRVPGPRTHTREPHARRPATGQARSEQTSATPPRRKMLPTTLHTPVARRDHPAGLRRRRTGTATTIAKNTETDRTHPPGASMKDGQRTAAPVIAGQFNGVCGMFTILASPGVTSGSAIAGGDREVKGAPRNLGGQSETKANRCYR